MVIYVLTSCPTCQKDKRLYKFALIPYPIIGGYLMYDREFPMADMPIATVSGQGVLCPEGHEVDVLSVAAVLTEDGRWLILDKESMLSRMAVAPTDN